jgi:hypothetical protein
MQITFKSPGSFARADALVDPPAVAADSGPNDGRAFSRTTSPDRFQNSQRYERFDSSPFQMRTGASAMNAPGGVNFSPSVFLRSTPSAIRARSPMQMVDGFAVPSPSMSQSGKKKRGRLGHGGGKSSVESARKRAASVPAGASESAASVGTMNLSPVRRSARDLTPESSFELGASAGFSDERIGILSPSDGEIELSGRESLGTVVSLRVSAGTTPSPALKSVMQSIAMQSGIPKGSGAGSKGSSLTASSPGATVKPQSSVQAKRLTTAAAFDSKEAAADGGLSTQLEREKILGRASSMSDAERGVLSVNLAAQKFSPPNPRQANPQSVVSQQKMQQAAAELDRHRQQQEQEQQEQQQEQEQQQDEENEQAAVAGLSPASFYRSATGHSPYNHAAENAAAQAAAAAAAAAAGNDESPSHSPSSSSSSSPTSSPEAPSPTYEERQAAAARDRSLVDQLVQPISQPVSQEWTQSPAATAW